ncbi:MAG: peptidoglycan-binding domain-containing protein [Faecalibacterium prausnitzii]
MRHRTCRHPRHKGDVALRCTEALSQSTTYNTFILPTIRRGSVGDVNRTATKMLQRLLGLTPDGIFGEKTENALLKAQEKHKLAVDGICGPASWRAISGANKYL